MYIILMDSSLSMNRCVFGKNYRQITTKILTICFHRFDFYNSDWVCYQCYSWKSIIILFLILFIFSFVSDWPNQTTMPISDFRKKKLLYVFNVFFGTSRFITYKKQHNTTKHTHKLDENPLWKIYSLRFQFSEFTTAEKLANLRCIFAYI